MTNPVSLPFFYCSWIFLPSKLTLCNISSFLTRSVQLNFSILLQHHTSELFKVFVIFFPKCPSSCTPTRLWSKCGTLLVRVHYIYFHIPPTTNNFFEPHNGDTCDPVRCSADLSVVSGFLVDVISVKSVLFCRTLLTLIPLMWRIWRAPNNASKWQVGLNLAFKVLTWI